MKDKTPKQRKLSKAELKRKAEFEALSEKLLAEEYKPNHMIMSVAKANVLGFLAPLPFVILFLVLYFVMGNTYTTLAGKNMAIVLLAFMVLIVVHELIHGITWSIFAKNGWKSISFGFIVAYLTPYCSCNEPMKKYQSILSALMPTLLLGFIPCTVAVFTGSSVLLAIGILLIFGGGGDLLIIFMLLRHKSPSKDVLFIDHPYELGTAVFEK